MTTTLTGCRTCGAEIHCPCAAYGPAHDQCFDCGRPDKCSICGYMYSGSYAEEAAMACCESSVSSYPLGMPST